MGNLGTTTWSKSLNSSLPRQQIPLLEKERDVDMFGVSRWKRENLDSLEGIGRYQFFNSAGLKDNYDIAEGNFNINHYIDSNDYYDTVSAISEQLQLPNFLKHYDITGKAVKLLSGEYLKRPDIFRIKDKSPDATNERLRVKTDLVREYFQGNLQKELDGKMLQMGFNPNQTQFKSEEDKKQYEDQKQKLTQQLTPEGIEKYMKYDYRSAGESWGNGVISTLKEKFYFRENEFAEFKDTMITGRVCSHFRLTPDGFTVERWQPLNTFYQVSPEVKWWQDGDYVGRVFFESKARILDRYGWKMTNEQKEALYPEYIKPAGTDGSIMKEFFSTSLYPFDEHGYRSYKNVTDSLGFEPLTGFPTGGGIPQLSDAHLAGYFGYSGYAFGRNDLVQCTEAYWRSQRQIGQLIIINPQTGQPETHIVDETFDAKLFGIKEIYDQLFEDVTEPNTCTWTWITQIWEGVKINTNYSKTQDPKAGTALYLNIKPTDFQFKGEYNPFLQPKLPVCGVDFGKMVVDLLKPYQLLYNVLFNQSYELIQRNNGKFLLMDINFLPTLKDWGGEDSIQKAMTIAKTIGFLPVDSKLSNTLGANFNQNTTVDLDDTPKIERLINLAMLIEVQAFKQIGITPQREGQVQASETATGTNAAISNSYSITEPYFENFFSYKKRKLQMTLDMAQFLSCDGKDITLSYTMSDLSDAWVKVTGKEMLTMDLGIYADYSQKTQDDLAAAKRMIEQNNTTGMPLSALIKVLALDNMADIEAAVAVGEDKMAQQEQQKQEAAQKLQQMQIDAAKQQDAVNKQFEAEQSQLDRQNKIDIEVLKGIAAEGSFSQTEDLTPSLIDQGKILNDKAKIEAEQSFKNQTLLNQTLAEFNKNKLEQAKLTHDKQIKDNEHKLKKGIETSKLKQIQTQNKNQLDLSNSKHENDLKLQKEKHKSDMEIADKQLKMKELDKQMKLLELENAKSKSNLELDGLEKKMKVEENLGKVKVKTIKEIADAKIEAERNVAEVKSKEIEQSTDLKMEENLQKHEHKLKENIQTHKQRLTQIKIKPKKK